MPERAPVIVRVLDALALIALLFALTIFLTGGFREFTPFGRVSITSWARPLVAALVLVSLRHWWWPRPALSTRAWLGARRAWAAPERRRVLPIVLSTRGAIFIVGFFAIVLLGYRPDVDVPWRVYANELLNLPARWDTGWYLSVAIEGYRWVPALSEQQQNIAFFPLYPLLVRNVSLLLGRQTMWAGVLISWIAFFWALVYLYRFARERTSDEAASTAIALLACYPFAMFFGVVYAESLFLLTLVAACYHFERDELGRAAAWGFAAGLTRPNGCLLSLVLALIAMRYTVPSTDDAQPTDAGGPVRRAAPAASNVRPLAQARPTTGDGRQMTDDGGRTTVALRIAVAAAPVAGLFLYSTYIYLLAGNPLQWLLQNPAFGQVEASLGAFTTGRAQTIANAGLDSFAGTGTRNALHLIAAAFVLASAWPVCRSLGLAYAALIVINVVPLLLLGALLPLGRATSVLFPTFVWLGAALPTNHRPAWLGLFALLQAVCAAMFFTWRPL